MKEKNFDRVFKLKLFTSRLILLLQGIYVRKLRIPENLKGPFVICSNHASYLDIIMMYPILPTTKFLFIGKSELLRWPVLNIFFKKIDIAVNREKRHSAMKSIIRAKKEIAAGWSVVIYPEGKIPIDTPNLHPFKNGAFKMAIEEQVPILPITLIDTWRLFNVDPVLTAWARPGISRVIIHDPIITHGLVKEDLVNLRNQTYKVINQPLLDDPRIKRHGNNR
ncbi:MAG: lysophospholipid acyltransferase family protein [Crocinitomicaceae bacterium]